WSTSGTGSSWKAPFASRRDGDQQSGQSSPSLANFRLQTAWHPVGDSSRGAFLRSSGIAMR
ncbi:hypothetical protein, partial [Sphingomonas mali]|uniref:hypothetical protein n=1 Tax=Sphingomonas mali TaxID=40682 RepID=UPI001C3FDA6D